MPKFRKKPVVIEARRLPIASATRIGDIMEWCGSTEFWTKPGDGAVYGIIVPTLEGRHEAGWGDWIIKGIKGEFYPCKDDIFQATYEAAE